MNAPDSRLVVYYSDQVVGSNHASVESLFHRHLHRHVPVLVVYYDRQAERTAWLGERRVVIPYRRRGRMLEELSTLFPLSTIACVIVRNIFPVCRNALRHRPRYGFKVFFHYSFPHTYRHYFAQPGFGLAKARKWLNWRVRHYLQLRLLACTDGILAISERLPAMLGLPKGLPVLPIHSGVDFSTLPAPAAYPIHAQPRRFLYVGTMDEQRRMDVVLQGFDLLERADWHLDIHTAQETFSRQLVGNVMSRHQARVTVHPAIPRDALYEVMRGYPIALCLIPPNALYQVSSPLKLMEYYAMGVPVVMSLLPECLNLFGPDRCGWFARFAPADIRRALEEALDTPPATCHAMGRTGREIVMHARNYATMAERLAGFLFGGAPPA
ncbi:MAG: glycosyltransferase [Magnetococcales bacterium]|nr:glycosyltransferase [Magnetococcales bacterium]